jgi:16S rRNA (cytosine967-C5)-methyltransferase
MDTVQQNAVHIISKVLQGRNLNEVIKETLANTPNLTAQQCGALQDLSYGTIRFYGQLNHILDALLNKPIKDIYIRYLLLVALYQLQYSKAAHYAVVDFAVNSVRKRNPAASGLANAVLRNFLRNQNTLIAQAEQNDESRYSYPGWWINRVISQYKGLAEDILIAGNQHPPMTLRVNSKLTNTEEYLKLLAQVNMQGIIIEPAAILLKTPVPVEILPGFSEGYVSVQDAGAQYAANFLDVKEGTRVLDACAAPGGKAAHLLELAQIELVAVDKDKSRMQRVNENLNRLKLSANLVTGDASHPEEWWDGKLFQRILADVPCSASGVVRRHPDIKLLRRDSDIENFAQQQLKILSALWELLEAGGKLLYVTCSIFEQENQLNIKRFVSEHSNAINIPLAANGMKEGQFLPDDKHDGFFYALLHKQV